LWPFADSALAVSILVFWKRHGFGECFEGRVGFNAFKANLLLLASLKLPTLPLTYLIIAGLHNILSFLFTEEY